MAQIEILLPKMGESVAEATIIKWLKAEGDAVDTDEPIVEIATDKVDSEVPAPEGGVLIKRLVNEGDVVQVGQPIALIGSAASAAESAPVVAASNAAPAVTAEPQAAVLEAVAAPLEAELDRSGPSGRFYSPLVRNIAKTEGIPMNELESLNGSGRDGRVTKKDILAYVSDRQTTDAPASPSVTTQAAPAPASAPASSAAPAKKTGLTVGPNDEIIEMDRMRKMISEHMVMSKHTAPHVTSFVEVDVTNIVMWRTKWKNHFETKEGEKLTYTPMFLEAVAKAIKDYPGVNASVDGDRIIRRKNINLGMAAALPSGNLIVPVIHNADQYNLVGLTKKVNDLANRARQNKLSPDEISGGTYTVTNVGTFGNVMGTPIINQPQVGILAIGAIRKKPVVIETELGDTIGIRHMMFLSHSYDHRVVDGMLGGSFVRKVADYLEAFDINREP